MVTLLLAGVFILGTFFQEDFPQDVTNGVDPGKPLFLTPYLEAGQIEKARKLSLVGPLMGTNIKSYSGFLTVNKEYNSNMFFWFIPAKQNPEASPLLLWLQGGPGISSLEGLFMENGPFKISKDWKLSERDITWQTKYSMLYIDNPVGTGFSFTNDTLGYARNETQIGNELYSALTQFFQIYYEYQKNDFYTSGQSYAGKYVPAISYKIHKENPSAKVKINFKGMLIGAAFSDPETMFPLSAEFMYQTGLFDENTRDIFQSQVDVGIRYMQEKKWRECGMLFDRILVGCLFMYRTLVQNLTGLEDISNYMNTNDTAVFGYYPHYLAKGDVRYAIHVGNVTFSDRDMTYYYLLDDMCQSVSQWVIEILNNDYKVMFYNGQLDAVIASPLVERFLWNLQWKGMDEYRKAQRQIWKVNQNDTDVAGYVRAVGPGLGNIFQVLIRGAGHVAPYDQPERTLNMISNFVDGSPWVQ
ncbi:putative serine carboxypeptidase CPVL [Glandiceps talaboti]